MSTCDSIERARAALAAQRAAIIAQFMERAPPLVEPEAPYIPVYNPNPSPCPAPIGPTIAAIAAIRNQVQAELKANICPSVHHSIPSIASTDSQPGQSSCSQSTTHSQRPYIEYGPCDSISAMSNRIRLFFRTYSRALCAGARLR